MQIRGEGSVVFFGSSPISQGRHRRKIPKTFQKSAFTVSRALFFFLAQRISLSYLVPVAEFSWQGNSKRKRKKKIGIKGNSGKGSCLFGGIVHFLYVFIFGYYLLPRCMFLGWIASALYDNALIRLQVARCGLLRFSFLPS